MERFPQQRNIRCCVVFHTPRLGNMELIFWDTGQSGANCVRLTDATGQTPGCGRPRAVYKLMEDEEDRRSGNRGRFGRTRHSQGAKRCENIGSPCHNDRGFQVAP